MFRQSLYGVPLVLRLRYGSWPNIICPHSCAHWLDLHIQMDCGTCSGLYPPCILLFTGNFLGQRGGSSKLSPSRKLLRWQNCNVLSGKQSHSQNHIHTNGIETSLQWMCPKPDRSSVESSYYTIYHCSIPSDTGFERLYIDQLRVLCGNEFHISCISAEARHRRRIWFQYHAECWV